MKKLIYILEDDESIRELISYTLIQTGYQAEGFELPSDFFKKINKEIPDLILLDIMLPEEDGIQVLKRLKEDQNLLKIPVIILTAKSSEYDTVLGLNSGADDYIIKPFGMMELLARIKAVLRRYSKEENNIIKISNLEVNQKKHQVLVDGKKIKLTGKEYQLLIILLENLEIVISRNQLLNKIWGYSKFKKKIGISC